MPEDPGNSTEGNGGTESRCLGDDGGDNAIGTTDGNCAWQGGTKRAASGDTYADGAFVGCLGNGLVGCKRRETTDN